MKRRNRTSRCRARKVDNCAIKALSVAAAAGLVIVGGGALSAQATTINDIDMSKKSIDTPTLDYLHKNDVKMTDENGTETAVYPESGYKYTKVEAKEDGSKPDGDNIVTKYEVREVTRYYDKTTGELVENPVEGFEYKQVQEKELVPVYFSVDLKQTEYGNKDATNQEVKYYSWTKDSDGNNTLTEGTEGAHDITYYVDKDRLSERITTNQNGADIDKDFVGNSTTTSTSSYGGAIYNIANETIGDITGNFIGNYASSSADSSSSGGAIYNAGTIGDITGDFIGNYSKSLEGSASGGAINNKGTIGDITGDFIGNYNTINSWDSYYSAQGGAISNTGSIGNITGDFIRNYANSENTNAQGGAIYNTGSIGDITGDFIKNYAESNYGISQGGAIYNKKQK